MISPSNATVPSTSVAVAPGAVAAIPIAELGAIPVMDANSARFPSAVEAETGCVL